MRIKTVKLVQFQELVKRHDFRFQQNPRVNGDWTSVSIDGDHLSITQCNAFFVEWERLNTPIVESRAKFAKLVRMRVDRLMQQIIARIARFVN